jgi:hypothetical protein
MTAATVFTLVVLLYIPTLRGGFVYDSIAQVLYSDYIHTPSNWADVCLWRVVGLDGVQHNRPYASLFGFYGGELLGWGVVRARSSPRAWRLFGSVFSAASRWVRASRRRFS